MTSRIRTLLLVGALTLVLAAACALPVEPTPVPGETPEPGPAQDALIDEVLFLTEGRPLESYAVEIRGHFRDGCTVLDMVTRTIEGDRIEVTVHTTRDPEALCTQALVPFEVTMPLELEGLAPGRYTLDVHGVTTTLDLGRLDEPVEAPVLAQDALIDAVLVLEETLPHGPYVLEIQGNLRDGCTSLGPIKQAVEGDRIRIRVTTLRPRDAICTQALVPFTHTIPLNVAGLAPGEYTVDVHGVTTTLSLSAEGAAPPPPEREAIRQGDLAAREGMVEQIDVLVLESFPVQINVVIQGHLADGCTRLSEIVQLVRGRTIQLVVYTVRPRDAICTLALVPFRETVRLDTRGLAPGEYTLQVHGLTETLTLDEGILGAPGAPETCAEPGEEQQQLINVADGYCLVHPEIYSARPLAPGALVITAMERGDLPEARIVSLLIEQMGPTEGRTLEELADLHWGPWLRQGIRLTRSEALFGDAPALVADGVPGRMAGRQALVADGGVYYLLTLTPVDRAYARQTAYSEELWQAVVASWRFYR